MIQQGIVSESNVAIPTFDWNSASRTQHDGGEGLLRDCRTDDGLGSKSNILSPQMNYSLRLEPSGSIHDRDIRKLEIELVPKGGDSLSSPRIGHRPEQGYRIQNGKASGILGLTKPVDHEVSRREEEDYQPTGESKGLASEKTDFRRPPNPFVLLEVDQSRPEFPTEPRIAPVFRIR